MTEHDFCLQLLERLPYTPNEQQMKVALALSRYCLPNSEGQPDSDRVFILNGYAGTGKTSLTSALVKTLRFHHIETILLAPTGRAAKVFAAQSGENAYTIHRKIYQHSILGGNFSKQGYAPKENKSKNAVFIVDEASMISSGSESDSHNILADLIQYVFSSQGCKLILMGDTAQLPPIGLDSSPAMEPDVLRQFGLKVTRATLTDVARQAAQSGILYNATRLRRALHSEEERPFVPLVTSKFSDVSVIEGADLPDTLDSLYREDGGRDTIIITRSNRSAAQFNAGIRANVLYREEQLCPGDLLIAAKNNYFFASKVKGLDFVANGEVLRVEYVNGSELKYGLHFADVTLSFVDRPDLSFDAKIILNALRSEALALDTADYHKLFEGVYKDTEVNPPGTPDDLAMLNIRKSPYWNALQVKYAYAVTCHKAQGGQWKNVFIDLSYIPPELLGKEFIRWLYTAVTRAVNRLYLINPPEQLIQ